MFILTTDSAVVVSPITEGGQRQLVPVAPASVLGSTAFRTVKGTATFEIDPEVGYPPGSTQTLFEVGELVDGEQIAGAFATSALGTTVLAFGNPLVLGDTGPQADAGVFFTVINGTAAPVTGNVDIGVTVVILQVVQPPEV
jgi:hypothetical protein